MQSSLFRFAWRTLLCVMVAVAPLAAQAATANVVGTVSDSCRAVVPNATVRITNTQTVETEVPGFWRERVSELLNTFFVVNFEGLHSVLGQSRPIPRRIAERTRETVKLGIFSNDQVVKRRGIAQFTGRTLSSWERHLEENDCGVRWVAAPIVDALRGSVAAIGVSGPTVRLEEDEAARGLSSFSSLEES